VLLVYGCFAHYRLQCFRLPVTVLRCSSRSSMREEHLIGLSMSVCLSRFSYELGNSHFFPKSATRTQGAAIRAPPTGVFHPKFCSSGALSSQAFAPLGLPPLEAHPTGISQFRELWNPPGNSPHTNFRSGC
jgi:hypothetical protein